jgi:mRNA-degrading endonuclease RelE of RelBE toxin-antitoxin system
MFTIICQMTNIQVYRVFCFNIQKQARLFQAPTASGKKIRWAMSGKGKSGGVRVIYYFKRKDNEIWLLTIYSKGEVENIPAHVLRQIAKEIENV